MGEFRKDKQVKNSKEKKQVKRVNKKREWGEKINQNTIKSSKIE